MSILTVQKPGAAGATLALAAASAGGDSFPNSGVEWFHVLNSHATAPRTVTFDSPGTCSFGLAANPAHDLAVVVPGLDQAPNNRVVIGPFPTGRFNDGNNRVQVSYSNAAADLTVAVQSGA
jgi:hypothetical protein